MGNYKCCNCGKKIKNGVLREDNLFCLECDYKNNNKKIGGILE